MVLPQRPCLCRRHHCEKPPEYIIRCLQDTAGSEEWHEGHRMHAYGPRNDGLHSAIHRAFRITEAAPTELSFGDSDDTGTTILTDMQLLQPEDPRSEYEALWLTMIGEKLNEGWRVAYSDGCGRDNHNLHACHREDRRGQRAPQEGT